MRPTNGGAARSGSSPHSPPAATPWRTISIRSSFDARFPAQGHDVRAAVRWLREHAAAYGIDPNRFAFMGNSSGGWAAAFAATTGDIMELPGKEGVDGTSSAVQVAVPFFPPTSPEVFLIECPDETEAADPSTYIEGAEIPIWVLHGLADPLLPYNQSQLVYDTTAAEGRGRDDLGHQPRWARDRRSGHGPELGRHRAVPARQPEPCPRRRPLT